MKTWRGMTLVELLIVMGIASVLLALSLSAYDKARAAVLSNDAQASLQQALRRAIQVSGMDRQHVVVCASADGEACSASVEWEQGWIAFMDRNRDRAPDAGSHLLQRQRAFDGALRIRSTAGRTRIVLQPHGGGAAGSNATFTVCDARGPAHARTVVLANSGRVRSGMPAKTSAVTCP